MRKILISLALISSLAVLLLPQIGFGQPPLPPPADGMPQAPYNAICCQLKTGIKLFGVELDAGAFIGDDRVPKGVLCQSLNDPTKIKDFARLPDTWWKSWCKDFGDPDFGWGVAPKGYFVGCYLRHDVVVDGVGWPKDTFVFYEECPTCCLLNTIYNVTDIVFVVAMALAGVLIVLGGVMFLVSGGDPERAKLAKNIILYTVIGIAVVLLARALIAIIAKIVVG